MCSLEEDLVPHVVPQGQVSGFLALRQGRSQKRPGSAHRKMLVVAVALESLEMLTWGTSNFVVGFLLWQSMRSHQIGDDAAV